MQLNFQQIVIPPGRQVLFTDINWQTFEDLLEELGDHRATRLSYSQGELEIMVPLPGHEDDKGIIGRLVEALLEELDIECRSLGSTTLKNPQMAQAVEPDECFYIEHEAIIRGQRRLDFTVVPPPDLVIEIDITSRTRFNNYELLGVPEIWRYDGNSLKIRLLKDGHYVSSETSPHFPYFPLREAIPHYLKKSGVIGRNATMREFRAWVNTIKEEAHRLKPLVQEISVTD